MKIKTLLLFITSLFSLYTFGYGHSERSLKSIYKYIFIEKDHFFIKDLDTHFKYKNDPMAILLKNELSICGLKLSGPRCLNTALKEVSPFNAKISTISQTQMSYFIKAKYSEKRAIILKYNVNIESSKPVVNSVEIFEMRPNIPLTKKLAHSLKRSSSKLIMSMKMVDNSKVTAIERVKNKQSSLHVFYAMDYLLRNQVLAGRKFLANEYINFFPFLDFDITGIYITSFLKTMNRFFESHWTRDVIGNPIGFPDHKFGIKYSKIPNTTLHTQVLASRHISFNSDDPIYIKVASNIFSSNNKKNLNNAYDRLYLFEELLNKPTETLRLESLRHLNQKEIGLYSLVKMHRYELKHVPESTLNEIELIFKQGNYFAKFFLLKFLVKINSDKINKMIMKYIIDKQDFDLTPLALDIFEYRGGHENLCHHFEPITAVQIAYSMDILVRLAKNTQSTSCENFLIRTLNSFENLGHNPYPIHKIKNINFTKGHLPALRDVLNNPKITTELRLQISKFISRTVKKS